MQPSVTWIKTALGSQGILSGLKLALSCT